MRYLIVGCGRVGSALAKYLDADGHEVIVIDENAAAFKRLGQKFKGHVVVGTGIDFDVLKRAGAATADGFVAVTNGDNRNIMAALIAQRDVQNQTRRRAHLRSPARTDVPRARRRDRLSDDRRCETHSRRPDRSSVELSAVVRSRETDVDRRDRHAVPMPAKRSPISSDRAACASRPSVARPAA